MIENKRGRGIASLFLVILLMGSILGVSLYYNDHAYLNKITGLAEIEVNKVYDLNNGKKVKVVSINEDNVFYYVLKTDGTTDDPPVEEFLVKSSFLQKAGLEDAPSTQGSSASSTEGAQSGATSSKTIAQKNNNPLNIKVTQKQVDEGTYPGLERIDENGYGIFNNLGDGYKSGIIYIERAINGDHAAYTPDTTLEEFFRIYTGNNYDNHLILTVFNTAYEANTKIKDVDPNILAQVIAKAEDGQSYSDLISNGIVTNPLILDSGATSQIPSSPQSPKQDSIYTVTIKDKKTGGIVEFQSETDDKDKITEEIKKQLPGVDFEITGIVKGIQSQISDKYEVIPLNNKWVIKGPKGIEGSFDNENSANEQAKILQIQYDQKKYEKTALDDAKEKTLSQLNDLDENQLKYAYKGEEVYIFDKTKNEYVPIPGGEYKTYERIGDAEIIRTKDEKTRTTKSTLLKSVASEINIDEETAKLIEQNGFQGIKDESVDTLSGKSIYLNDGTLIFYKEGWSQEYGGTKIVQKTDTLIFYNERIISKAQYDKLPQDEQKKAETKETLVSKVKEDSNSESKWTTNYYFYTKYDVNSKPIRYHESVTRDSANNVIRFGYAEEDEEEAYIETEGFSFGANPFSLLFGKFEDSEVKGNLKFKDEVISQLRRFSSRLFILNVEKIFTEFRGLGYYATLFFDDDTLLEWREGVDKAFATFYLGTEYWGSAICGQYIDGEDEGIAYAETPQGLSQIGAHIEATRTEPIVSENGTIFIYKITFNVRNGDYDKDPKAPEEMNIKVILKGDRNANVFSKPVKIKRGSSFGKSGSNAIVQDSKALYRRICIKFDEVPSRWKLDDNELCNSIQETSTEPLLLSELKEESKKKKGGVEESEINDF